MQNNPDVLKQLFKALHLIAQVHLAYIIIITVIVVVVVVIIFIVIIIITINIITTLTTTTSLTSSASPFHIPTHLTPSYVMGHCPPQLWSLVRDYLGIGSFPAHPIIFD